MFNWVVDWTYKDFYTFICFPAVCVLWLVRPARETNGYSDHSTWEIRWIVGCNWQKFSCSRPCFCDWYSSRRTSDFLVFETVFQMWLDGRLLVNFLHSGKPFNINNMGFLRTWIMLNIYFLINVFWNEKLLAKVARLEGVMAIHCNAGVFQTSLAEVIPGFDQDTTWYYP